MKPTPIALAALLAFAACSSEQQPSVTRAQTAPAPTPAPVVSAADKSGQCWAREVTPAVYEHVMGEVQVVQAEIAPDGTVLRPPVYRRAPVPRIVKPRAEMRFEAPCAEAMTPEFIASVQRALAARGYFAGNVTGVIDGTTAASIRRYQTERGLSSAQLSLQTARDLGLIAVEIEPRES
ncbi:peptidoglycan-binding domain-containing protein [Thalassococcus lentus]|uniref:Peptidoglycan-binding domain-containing protein n=1 Tax=Thalassococcus lentus TaxID=1210524 RepID=A0ABT4XSE0_9RHOB|nr:peptidoglycan-binding domain-containing protein [Thalassococcus lentus]MDA7424863.1 peptidoglycan-binding domain-containing protein [Thalassococcus lentus]